MYAEFPWVLANLREKKTVKIGLDSSVMMERKESWEGNGQVKRILQVGDMTLKDAECLQKIGRMI